MGLIKQPRNVFGLSGDKLIGSLQRISKYQESDPEGCYLEIGVRNPQHNFNHIKANKKYSVDPGVEFKSNPVDFKITSDVFFLKLSRSEVLSNKITFSS